MYHWKCWHDSRDRLVLYGGAGLMVTALIGLDTWEAYEFWMAWWPISGNRWLRLWDPALSSWSRGMNLTAGLSLDAAIWLALVFGFTSVGREYGAGTMAFVLTRPQKRWRIVWDEWLLAVAEICIVLSMLIIGIAPFLYMINKTCARFAGLILPGALAMAACLYGLTQFFTLLTGSGARGLSATVAAALFYIFLPGALNDWWHIGWPLKVTSMSFSIFDVNWDEMQFPPGEIALLWAVVALIFPFLSQWLMEQREV